MKLILVSKKWCFTVCMIDMENKTTLRSACMKETADLGVDLIIDLRPPNCAQVSGFGQTW